MRHGAACVCVKCEDRAEEFWKAAERRRIRRALSPLRAALVSAAIIGTGPYGVAQNKAEARKLLDMLDRATKAPKRKATKGTPR